MDKDLELFHEYLESPLWTHPIMLFVSELYCAYAYNCDFQNGKNDEMNRKFYHKYCALLADLLLEFSSDYEIDTGKVSQFINTCIEQTLPVAKHLVATQSYKQFVDLMKSYTIELKMQPPVEPMGLPDLCCRKLAKTCCVLYDQKSMEKKMQEFAKQRDCSLLMERRSTLQTKGTTVNESKESSQSHLTKANLDTPGMAIAMAYGFVAYENTVEYKMEKWYEAEKAQKPNTKQSPKEGIGEQSNTDPKKETVDKKAHQESTTDVQEQRRSSRLRCLKSQQLDDIPEASEDHLELNKIQ